MDPTDETADSTERCVSSKSKLRGHVILGKYIIEALKKQQSLGYSGDYQTIIKTFSEGQVEEVMLCRWLPALKMCVSHFTQEFEDFVRATLNLQWAHHKKEVTELYSDYIIDLLSAHTFYLKPVLYMLVKNLMMPVPKESESVYLNSHQLLKKVAYLVPTSPSYLLKVLECQSPYQSRTAEYQEVFVRNALHVSTYCPTLRDDILALVVMKMIKIDVEVPRHLLDDEEDADTSENLELEENGEQSAPSGQCAEDGSNVFPEGMDVTESVCATTGQCISDPLEAEEGKIRLCPHYCYHGNMSNENADKLDTMMTVVLEYIDGVCYRKGVLQSDSTLSLFQALMKQVFERHILPTHDLAHVQFLIFRITSFDPQLPGYFLDFLWEKFQDTSTPAVIRQSAAAYMASFIARAKFVTVSSTKLCLSIMVQWLHSYLDTVPEEALRADFFRHGPFYCMCQAAFYVFVFRHKELLDMEGAADFLCQLKFERLISSKINPLKVCLPLIVDMFASVANKYQIAFCYTIIEENKRTLLPHVPLCDSGPSQTPELKSSSLISFFPFDPFCLKRSSRFVTHLHQEWSNEEFEDGEESARIEKEEKIHELACSPNSLLSSSLESVSISMTTP